MSENIADFQLPIANWSEIASTSVNQLGNNRISKSALEKRYTKLAIGNRQSAMETSNVEENGK
jgi:hypothetical protein